MEKSTENIMPDADTDINIQTIELFLLTTSKGRHYFYISFTNEIELREG
jgi:hypothetical protein